jgi:hypothetical protein
MEERREQKTIEGFGRIFKPRYRRKGADGSQRVYEIQLGGLPTTTTARSYGNRAIQVKRKRQSSS